MPLVVKASAGAVIEVDGVRFVTKRNSEFVFLNTITSMKRDGIVIIPKPGTTERREAD